MSQPYSSSLLNELHARFPALLYRPTQFQIVGDVLNYIIGVARQNPYDAARIDYERLQANDIMNATTIPVGRVTRPEQVGLRPEQVGLRPEQVGLRPEQVGLRPEQVGLRPEQVAPRAASLTIPLISDVMNYIYPDELLLPSRQRSAPPRRPTQTEQLLSAFFGSSNLMEPVIVRPTHEQIASASVLTTINPTHENCAICQDGMEEGQSVRILSHCIHRFHQECIDTWFQSHVTCPTCRHDIRE